VWQDFTTQTVQELFSEELLQRTNMFTDRGLREQYTWAALVKLCSSTTLQNTSNL